MPTNTAFRLNLHHIKGSLQTIALQLSYYLKGLIALN